MANYKSQNLAKLLCDNILWTMYNVLSPLDLVKFLETLGLKCCEMVLGNTKSFL